MNMIALRLKANPIYDTGNEQEPIYALPRSYADMENEITTKLVTMPLFHARCKLSNREYTIRTFPPPPAGDDFRPLPTWISPAPTPIGLSPQAENVGEQVRTEKPIVRYTGLVRRTPKRRE